MSWWQRRKAKKEHQKYTCEFERGFQWAAVELLKNVNGEGVDLIARHTYGNADPFDRGAKSALRNFTRLIISGGTTI